MINDPVVTQPNWRIVGLQHVSFILTQAYFLLSGSRIKLTSDWRVDPTARYVIASTHLSWFDPFMVTTALGWKRLRPLLPCRFMATPGFLRNRWLRGSMMWLGSYPSHPFRDWSYGIDASKVLLGMHHTIVMFPQGKRTLDRTLPAKRGVAEIANATSAFIIPVLLVRSGSRFGLPSYTITSGAPFLLNTATSTDLMDHIFSLDTQTDMS